MQCKERNECCNGHYASSSFTIRGDMMEVCKIFSGKYDKEVTGWFTHTSKYFESYYEQRGHRFSIYQSQVHCNNRKFSFTNRIISL